MSERLVKDDVYINPHRRLRFEARDTKLGPEGYSLRFRTLGRRIEEP